MRRFAVLALAFLLASSASAQPVATLAPAPGSTTIDFESLTDGDVITNQFSGVTMTVSGGACANSSYIGPFADSDPISATNFSGEGNSCGGASTNPFPSLTFTFSQSITSFGFYGFSNSHIFLGNGNGSLMFNANFINLVWMGIADATPFTTVTASADVNGAFAFDHLAFGSAVVATPEPSAVALLATGLLGLGGIARRRRQSAA